MSLAPDSRLGPYEIIGKLGAGGMGEVYRARDPRLGRIVAVKLLTRPGDAGLRQRFEQEARAASALNHPNILTVHDVGEHHGAQYIVSELVEGEPLRALVQRGPVALRKALDIAMQIADGLAAAHKAGIAHRDLKPENVMLTPDGRAKILDFGLAKRTGRGAPAEQDATRTQATEAGMVVGTAGYMSPEQARGEEVDTRTDQFSFGTMLYEMLSGRQPFRRKSGPETMAAVIAEEPPALTDVPAPVRWAIERCMDKDPARRYGSTLDLFRDLAKLRDGLSEITVAATGAKPHQARWPWLAATAALLTGSAAAYLLHKPTQPSPPRRPLMLEIDPPAGTRFDPYGFKVSPDGRGIAFVTLAPNRGKQLWIRGLETGAIREVRAEGSDISSPFWAPDSRRLGFTIGGSMIYVSDGDGAARRVVRASGVTYPSWNDTAGIVFTEGGRIFTVSPSGGEPKLRSTANPIDGLISAVTAMPGAKRFGFEYRTEAGVGVGFGDGATNRFLFNNPNSPPRFAWSTERNATYVLVVDQGQLKVRLLDPESGDVKAGPAILADRVAFGPTFSASNTGVLAYYPEAPAGTYQYAVLDRAGKQVGSFGLAGPSGVVRISPDGRRAAFSRRDPEGAYHIWLAELESGRATPFTFGAESDNFPVWTPGGDQIFFIRTLTNRARRVMRKSVPVPGVEQMVFEGDVTGLGSVRADHLLMHNTAGLYFVDIASGKAQAAGWKIGGGRAQGRYSPDGRSVTYVSNETGRTEAYVRSVGTESKRQISTEGALNPAWRADGKALFYVVPDRGALVEAPLDGGPPKELFQASFCTPNAFDASPDGQHFIACMAQEQPIPLKVILNWEALLDQPR